LYKRDATMLKTLIEEEEKAREEEKNTEHHKHSFNT
jgi:hypothetical protein